MAGKKSSRKPSRSKRRTPKPSPVRRSSDRAILRASLLNRLYDWKRPAPYAQVSRMLASRKLRPISKKEKEVIQRCRATAKDLSGRISPRMDPEMIRARLLLEFQDPNRRTSARALRARMSGFGLRPPTREEIALARGNQKWARDSIRKLKKTMKKVEAFERELDKTRTRMTLS